MKLTYLGTAAAEGWPAVFCNCENCKEAARLGGRNIRTRSQALVNDDLLLDLPPDTYLHKLANGLDLTKVRYLFVTHWHMDHFYPQELTIRGSYYSHGMVSPELDVYCAEGTKGLFDKIGWEANRDTLDAIHFHILSAFTPVQAGPYTVTPLPANHMHELDGGGNTPHPYIYLIEEGGKKLLYGHDTGYFYPEVWDFLGKAGHIDLVSMDGTCGRRKVGLDGGHMGLPDNLEVKARLIEMGVCDEKTVFVINHFSHNDGICYDRLVPIAEKEGLIVSYDGMCINT